VSHALFCQERLGPLPLKQGQRRQKPRSAQHAGSDVEQASTDLEALRRKSSSEAVSASSVSSAPRFRWIQERSKRLTAALLQLFGQQFPQLLLVPLLIDRQKSHVCDASAWL
jgi:hypothetical protein